MSPRTVLIIAAAAVLVAGCRPENFTEADQCVRAEEFQKCLAGVPKGPDSTHYNDWGEVVGACDKAAYYLSLRERAQIKQECRL